MPGWGRVLGWLGQALGKRDRGDRSVWSLGEIREKIRTRELVIDWELTPETVLGSIFEFETPEDLEVFEMGRVETTGHYFCINVWDRKARLLLMESTVDIAFAVGEVREIPEDLLVEAIKEAGATVNLSGHYPINQGVRRWLKEALLD